MVDEKEFHNAVSSWLYESFQEIEHEEYIESGKRPDFMAHTPFESYVIEVEDTADTLYRAIGQVGIYAAELGYEPVVVFPAEEYPDDQEMPENVTVVSV